MGSEQFDVEKHDVAQLMTKNGLATLEYEELSKAVAEWSKRYPDPDAFVRSAEESRKS